MATTHDFTDGVPPEIQRIILTLVPRSDLKNVRLANKRWSAAAATILWSDLTLDFLETDKRKFNALLDSDLGGVLDCVRKISISFHHTNRNAARRRQVSRLLEDLLLALPQDGLTQFSSKGLCVTKTTISILLRTQSKLRKLAASISERVGGFPNKNLVRGNLNSLQELCVIVNGKEHQGYQGFASWFLHVPGLQKLEVRGQLSDELNYFEGWNLPGTQPILKLRSLELDNLHLPMSVDGILGLLHLPDLKSLTITNCLNAIPLLTSLAQALKKATATSLKVFRHVSSKSIDVCGSSTELISSTAGLEVFILVTNAGVLLNRSCLEQTGKCLRTLTISTCPQNPIYSTDDLEQLVTMCPNLHSLGVNLGNFKEACNGLQLLEPFELSRSGEIAEALNAVSRLQRLKELRLVHHPLLCGDHSALERQWRYGQMADEIMACLADNGSKVERLRFLPPLISIAHRSEADANGHVWPNYTYVRGKTLHETKDGLIHGRTVAIPSNL